MQAIANSVEILLDAGHVDAAKKLARTLQKSPKEKIKAEKDRDFIKEFKLYMREKELSKNTQRNYLDALRDYTGCYDEFTKESLIEWKELLLEVRAPKTVSSRVIAMNQFIKHILKNDDLLLKRVVIPNQTSVENVIDVDEYEKLSHYLWGNERYRAYWIVQFLARTGARVSELVRFEKEDLEQGFAQLMTKGKIRVIHIPEKLIEESKDFFECVDSDYLFPNRTNRNKPITPRGVSELIVQNGKKCGVRREVLHPHSFRHFFAIEFLKRNKDISLLADLMGHSSVATTQIYTRLSKEEQRSQLNKTIDW